MNVRFPLPKSDTPAACRRSVLGQVLTGYLGVLALIFQLLVPSFSFAAEGEWIEICSDVGAVLIEIDPDTGAPVQNDPCPDCDDCVMCAVSGAATMVQTLAVQTDPIAVGLGPVGPAEISVSNPAQFWSQLRGPPLAPQDIIERARRASMALTSNTGGVRWT